MRIFLLSHAEDNSIYPLFKKERNYLLNVLRLKIGDVFTAKNERGKFYKACLINEETLSLEETEKPEETLLDSLSGYKKKLFPIEVFQCICKGKKNEEIIRMLTEAGVERITFVSSDFTQQSNFTAHEIERLEKIRREAIQQSGSETTITDFKVLPFKQALESSLYQTILLHQSLRDKTYSLRSALKEESAKFGLSIFIGSEGGFSEEECQIAEEKGAFPVLLPTNILRAETAGIFTVGAILALTE